MEWVAEGEPTIQKQRGKWAVRQTGYDPATGRPKVRQLGTFPTKKAAVAFSKTVGVGQAGSDDETVAAFVGDVWLRSKEGRVERSTLDQYRWAVHRHIVPLIGGVRLRDLTPELVDEWIVELNSAPEGSKPRLGATSTRLVRKVLSMALEEAVQRKRLTEREPGGTQRNRRRRSDRRPHRAWTVDEEAGIVSVVQQLAVERGQPIMKQLKTEASDRVVAVGPRTVAALQGHRVRQAAEFVFLGLDPREVDLVFTSEVGGWIDPNNIGRTMKRLAKEAGVLELTPKGMRHTAQSIGRVVVGDDKVMQERLGHADIGVTLNTYTHLVSEQHRAAGDLIDGVFG